MDISMTRRPEMVEQQEIAARQERAWLLVVVHMRFDRGAALVIQCPQVNGHGCEESEACDGPGEAPVPAH
jgi:hypothetical protein